MPETEYADLLSRKLNALQGWAMALGAAMLMMTSMFVGYGAYLTHGRTADRQEARRFFCEQIETLKKGERHDAIRAYDELDKTLKLLKLERTPEIEEAAQLSRDRKLKLYAPVNCELVARGVLP